MWYLCDVHTRFFFHVDSWSVILLLWLLHADNPTYNYTIFPYAYFDACFSSDHRVMAVSSSPTLFQGMIGVSLSWLHETYDVLTPKTRFVVVVVVIFTFYYNNKLLLLLSPDVKQELEKRQEFPRVLFRLLYLY